MIKSNDDDFRSYEELIENLLEQLARLPGPVKRKVEEELKELLRLVRDRRPPRFMLVGRRGAGKSTLINAIFGSQVRLVGSVSSQNGAAQWLEYSQAGKLIEVLDTRGVQEGTKPVESDQDLDAVSSLKRAIANKCPDVVLFLIKAKEVDSAIAGDMAALEELHTFIEKVHRRSVPVVGVVTQCDELDPPDIRELPTPDVEKNGNIRNAVSLLEKHIESRESLAKHLARVVPVASYVRFRADGSLDAARDYRWNIDVLVGLLLEELPKEAKLDFARLAEIKQFQRNVALRVVDVSAATCGGIGMQPIPVADLPFITSTQILMIVGIAYVSGRDMTLEAAREFVLALGGNVGVAFALREGVRALLKLAPGWGNVISGGVAFAATELLGRAAVAYYIDHKSIEEVRQQCGKRKSAEPADA